MKKSARDFIKKQLSMYEYWVKAGPSGKGWGSFNESTKTEYQEIVDGLKAILGRKRK